jgi:pantoate--beta-alanine ligase
METVTTILEMRAAVRGLKEKGERIGFVPTMGYFHEGHLSLMRRSVKTTGGTVVSLFVNPTQFGPQEDLARYPKDLKKDTTLAEQEGVHFLFCPSAEEMYGPNFRTYVRVEGLETKLCGRTRPTHFRGVCTVVLKLFEIVRPDLAFFGQKDAQQSLIIKKMVRDLNLDVSIEVLPTVREADGLAMSSRNAYLSRDERRAAPVIYRSLEEAAGRVRAGERDARKLVRGIEERIRRAGAGRVDYVQIVDPETLEDLEALVRGDALVAAAVYFGGARLIDNIMLRVD